MGTRKALQFANDRKRLQADRSIPFTATVASVNTPVSVWTPSSATARFRFMGAAFSTSIASVAPSFKDGSAPSAFYSPGKFNAVNQSVERWLGRGYLSASANNDLRIDSDVPGATFTGSVFGREEP